MSGRLEQEWFLCSQAKISNLDFEAKAAQRDKKVRDEQNLIQKGKLL